MSHLPKVPEWAEGVYQLERNDPVSGGPLRIDEKGKERGTANKPLIDLANRTEWLKEKYDTAFDNLGWMQLGEWVVGLEVSLPNQIVNYGGSWYRYRGSLDIPHVIAGESPEEDGGVWSGDNPDGVWVDVGDASLRANLSSSDGLRLVGKVSTISALRTVEPLFDKQWINVEKYWDDSLHPLGTYWYDATDITSSDNGGTVIVTTLGARWKYVGAPTVETYGAYGDGVHDDAAAIRRCIAAEDAINFPGEQYLVISPIEPLRTKQIFQGAGTTALIGDVVSPAVSFSIFEFTLNWREGVQFRDMVLKSRTPGVGRGVYSPSSIYVANAFFGNVSFDASLEIGIDANLILCEVGQCRFGLEGTRGASFQAIRSVGQSVVGSNYITNANTIKNSRFFNSNSGYAIEFVNGIQCVFDSCDFESNGNTLGTVRVAGMLSAYFNKCWYERNSGRSFVSAGMDSVGTIQGVQVLSVNACWIKLENDNKEIVHATTTNVNISITDCAGTGFSGRNLFSINESNNPMTYLRDFRNNYFVGFSLLPQNTGYAAEMGVGILDLRDSAGAKNAIISASSSRLTMAHNNGLGVQKQDGTVFFEVVTTATGTQIRGRSADGTMYKLQPPNGGGAATWTGV
ncbi:hypothetical protein [Pectobacterium carotovorum]|uniref:hypothetical protein n=1 Tax=Pectobacterium carotovorum TaxID=554 RepID=UPI000582E781|nr:hypothetical protein [Pectobacterium carotovorum]KHS86509.1 hypothetical protein RC84_00990 [Pectobacterium carotovorum subsp. carotovorum]